MKSFGSKLELWLLKEPAQQGLCGFNHKAPLMPKLEMVVSLVEFQYHIVQILALVYNWGV